MNTFSANMILAFFDREGDLMFRVERAYLVRHVTASAARASEVAKISAALCRMQNVSWHNVVFDVTITSKKGVTA